MYKDQSSKLGGVFYHSPPLSFPPFSPSPLSLSFCCKGGGENKSSQFSEAG